MRKLKINTMEELSAAIGVSRPTLSRYFQSPGNVRSSTAAKIRAGLGRVDYVPNFFATRMNRKSSGLIGVIIPYFHDVFFASLIEVIGAAASEAGYTIITQSSRGNPATEAQAIEQLLSMSADGVLVAPLGASSNLDALERLSANVPSAFLDSRLPASMPKVDFIGTNNRQSIAVIVDYLCRTGKPPAFLRMPRLNSNSIEREASYVSQMEASGFEPRIIKGNRADENWQFEAHAYRLMDEQFSRGRYSEATILCANDRLAIGAIRAANQHGLFSRGPDAKAALRIAGHDDHPWSRFMTPALTTVAQDIEAIGRAAVRLIAQRIQAGANVLDAPDIQVFDAILRVRDSA